MGEGFVRGAAPAGRRHPEPVALVGWLVLGLLLAATLVAAIRFDRTGRPSLVGDEATYAMQAASLAWDFDLAYSRQDYDRFVAQWGGPPDGLILASRDGGKHLTYGKPFLYALVVAPFVRFAPVNGALVANVLLLAAAAVLAARALGSRIGAAAPLWVAVFVFASVAFAYAFWVHSDLFLLAATAAGFALVYQQAPEGAGGHDEPRGAIPQVYGGTAEPGAPRRLFLRWAAAGLLLAIPATFRPFYLVFLLPAALATPVRGRRQALSGLLAGALVLLSFNAAVQVLAGGDWSGYGGERQGFYARTGYPEVDFPASDWNRTIRTFGNTAWLQEGGIDPVWDARLWAWDGLYFLIGRNVGVLPYFLPLLLGFAAWRGERGRWAVPLSVAVAVLCFFAVRPFNFYGGGGAIGNRYFLPLYAALWFVAARPLRPLAGAALAALTAVVASVFLLPLWTHPTAFPIGEDGRYRHVSDFAARHLPYETTQSHIPGGQDVAQHDLWLKLLNHNVFRTDAGALEVAGSAPAELLVGSPAPLQALVLDFDRQAPSRLVVGGLELRPALLRPNGGVSFDLPLEGPHAVHPMWWTRDPYYLYQLDFHLPGAMAVPIGFRVLPREDRSKQIVIRRSGS